MSRFFRAIHGGWIALALVILMVSCYMWQARTTIENPSLCFHAHLGTHVSWYGARYDGYGTFLYWVKPVAQRGGNTDLTFLRHYHGPEPLGTCAETNLNGHAWTLDSVAGHLIGFEFRKYEASGRWPDSPGMYVFVRHTDEHLYPVYAGYTDSLRESLRDPDSHEQSRCIGENSATHIHARLDNGYYGSDLVPEFIRAFGPPCNGGSKAAGWDSVEMGTGLVEDHEISLVGRSGREYAYTNSGEYPAGPGNYTFAKYVQQGFDPNYQYQMRFGWVLLYVGKAANLNERLTDPGPDEVRPWGCADALGATHIFIRAHDGDRGREVNDLAGQHHLACNRLLNE